MKWKRTITEENYDYSVTHRTQKRHWLFWWIWVDVDIKWEAKQNKPITEDIKLFSNENDRDKSSLLSSSKRPINKVRSNHTSNIETIEINQMDDIFIDPFLELTASVAASAMDDIIYNENESNENGVYGGGESGGGGAGSSWGYIDDSSDSPSSNDSWDDGNSGCNDSDISSSWDSSDSSDFSSDNSWDSDTSSSDW